METRKRLDALLKLNEKSDMLTAWDTNFLKALDGWTDKGRKLSVRQNDVLQKIEAKLSPQVLKERRTWEENWNEEKRRNALICAHYYSHANYFTTLSARILAEPNWVMPPESYKKMCCNRYAKRVIEAVTAPPKYSKDAPVMLRKATARNFAVSRHVPLFILDVLPYVKNAAKGSKIYKVLAADMTKPFEIEERHIKKYRKPNK